LTEGEAVPADARILKSERLRLDVSTLTGESRPTSCTANTVSLDDSSKTIYPNIVYAGTSVVSGRGSGVVFATGPQTKFGRIAQLTQQQEERSSPLQKELERVTRAVTVLAVGLGVLFFIIGTLVGGLSMLGGFLFAIGIIVANVPEGLLPTLTLSLALSVRRMAQRNALVKRLSSVESLGATTIILTDKTGTLTENEMTVREAWTGESDFYFGGI
jgi:P-type E1-E2 ATPase